MKSNNVLEEKRKNGQEKICIKNDQQIYNNCYELRSGAIKNKTSSLLVEYILSYKTESRIVLIIADNSY